MCTENDDCKEGGTADLKLERERGESDQPLLHIIHMEITRKQLAFTLSHCLFLFFVSLLVLQRVTDVVN